MGIRQAVAREIGRTKIGISDDASREHIGRARHQDATFFCKKLLKSL